MFHNSQVPGNALVVRKRRPRAWRLAEAVEHFGGGEAEAGEDGGVLEGVEADLGLAELLDEVEEVFGEVGLEGDDELLIVQAEGVGGVEFDAGVEQADADVLVHEALALGEREEVPRARLPEGVDEDVLLSAGTDGSAALALTLVRAADLVLRALGAGEEVMRRAEVAAKGRTQEFGAHEVELVDPVADGPDAEVNVATGSDGGVGEREKLTGLVPLFEDGGEGGFVGGALGGGKASPLRHDFVEAEADDLAAGGRGRVVVRGGWVRGDGRLLRSLLCHGLIVSRTG